MGTMNGMQRPSLSDEAVARLVDPRTGTRLRPLGVIGGRTIWPMMGASPDDPSSSENTGQGTDDGSNPEGGKQSEGSGEGGESTGEKPKENPDAKIEDLEQEKERHYRRRKEAEQEAERLREELKVLKGKDTPETEKLTTRVAELETTNVALEESLRASRLENAFLKDNTFEWHNPGRALALADLSEVEIDDDGSVQGLKKALDKLAKSDPYLIKKEGKQEPPPPNTEDPKNPGKKKGSEASEEEKRKALLDKYPALRR